MNVMFWGGASEADKQLAVLRLNTFSRVKLGNHVCTGKHVCIGSSAYLVWCSVPEMRFGANMAEPPRTATERAWQLLQQLTEVLKRDLVFLVFPCLNESVI